MPADALEAEVRYTDAMGLLGGGQAVPRGVRIFAGNCVCVNAGMVDDGESLSGSP